MSKKAEPIDPLRYLDFLLARLKFDRYFYLAATGVSVLLLVYSIIALIQKGNLVSALAVCAPAGALGMWCSKILKIWNDCLKVIINFLNRANK